jgi:hypothetical protein
MSITKIYPYVAPLMCVAATVLSASSAAADNPITLENDFVKVTLDGQGLRKIHDKEIDRTVDLASDQFSLAVNGDVIESTSITPTVKEETNTTVAYVYRAGDYTVEAIYELRPAWRFVGKQLLLTCSEGEDLLVEKIQPFYGKLNNIVAEPFHLTGGRYGVSMRLNDVGGDESPAWGCFLLVQNPYTSIETTDSSVTLAYEPKMKWKSADGPFRSDRMCIGTFKLTGNTFRSEMAPEWRYVQDPDKFLTEGQQIDWAEIEAVTDCARAFLLEDRKKSVRVHIGWCENDYQIDFATEEGKTEYRRIIDQAAAMGCQYVLYTPSHSKLAPLQESRDAWKWESNLMLNVGQKFRKGEWVAGKDPLPDDIQGILDYAKSKQIELLAYAYPSLPYMQNPEWTRWLTEQGKQPAHYLTVDTGLRSFQDWYVDQLVAFCESTGCAGFSFDHWWTAYKPDLGDVSSIYQQWHGCRRILANLRRRMPRIIMDGRQQYHHFGTWTWLAGTYPHPMMSDEQPGSFNAIVDLSTDRVNGARQRFIAWRLMTRDFCPVEILPGFITHQTQRSDADRVMRRDRYRERDWDTLGWKYSLISSVATAPFNHVVNYIPARDSDEFRSFSEEDKAFFRRWLDFTDENMDVLRRVRPIIGQPMIGRCDGTAAIKENRGFVFLFNPNYRKMTAEFNLDESIGLQGGESFLIKQTYPVEHLNIGKDGSGCWMHGDSVSLPMDGTSACVLEIEPTACPIKAPILFGISGKVECADGMLTLSGVTGPFGAKKDVMVRLSDDSKIEKVTIGGKAIPFQQSGDIVNLQVTFAGQGFSQAQQIGEYDPNFKARAFEGFFTIPRRVFEQLNERKREWSVPYTEDDRVAPWIHNSRLLLFAQIAEPYAKEEVTIQRAGQDVQLMREVPYTKDEVAMEIDGKPIEVREGYNGVYPYVTRTCMGMYADISHLKPDTEYLVKLTLPDGLRPGQFQGLFFEHVVNEYTDAIVEQQ